MKKLYSYTYVYLAVFICLHYNIFAKTTDNPPLILKPTPVKALPVRFKPLPFKPLYLNKVDVYEFDQKAYVFKKNTSALPVLTAQEWQTVSNDPIRFTLMPNKRYAKVGEEIELTLTAELLNISPLLMFTFEELREYTLKVILPKDFIQTGGTYYDFISDKLNPANPRKTYTIKGRYLAKPTIDDCFEVLRKLNNEVFILKAKQCPLITEVDMASINTVIAADSLKNTRAITAIDLSKVKFTYTVHTTGRNPEQLPETPSIIYYNCYRWDNYSFSTMLDSVGRAEIIRNGGSDNWEMIQKNGNTILNQYSDCGQGFAGLYSSILASTTSITSTIKIYGSNVCPTPGNAVPIYTKSITYTIDRVSTPAHCVSQPVSFTITTNSTNLCPGNSTTITASNNCAGIITWKKNDVTYGNGGGSIVVSEAGTYKATCSNPSTTSNSIIISTSTSPAAPTVATDKSTLTPGEYASLTANNCSGTVLWTGPNNYAAVGSQVSVNKSGNYNAKCQTTCNGSTYYSGLSSAISISTAPLRIDVNKTQITPGESVTLTAIGCTNGYIKWKINDNLQATSDNPFTFNSSGFYSASCNSWDATYTSDWVTVFIHQLPANTPTITANKTRAYNNESITLTATGCTTYYWAIPVRLPDGSYVTPTPYPSSTSGSRTVTGPANYSVSCTNQGPWTNVTVYPSHPGDITISSNKTVANNDEAVQLSANGDCPSNAGIQWKIAGVSSWTTRNESKTVYGPGTYEARCIVDDLSYGSWASIRINAPAPGGITITSSKTSAASTELVTLRANGCTGEVVWTLPNNTEVRGSDILYATGPGTYKAKCVRFGLNGEIASIVIQTKPNDAPRFYATQSVAAANQMFQLVAENCPNNYVQWGVPKLDANGNIYYDYANFFTTLIVRGPGTYKVRCNEGNHTDFQDIIVFPSSSDALVIVANKARVLPTESVSLTAFGCPNGIVTWELGTSNVVGVQLNTSGPGTYKARCTGDPTNNGDYAAATILPNGSIVPSLSADKNTACSDEDVQVDAFSGSCPTGWPFQWQLVKNDKIDYWLNNRNAIENFGENYGDVFEIVSGNSITRRGPRVYYVRCLKPDGTWIGEFKDKSFIVEPVFPEYLRASNNGPALMGATGIKVAVTEVPGPNITYSWTGPAGSGFSSNVRNPTITGLTEAKSGIYTVTVRKTAPVACSVTATTNLVVSGCSDIRIKATDPVTGTETYSLPIVADQVNQYGTLALSPVYNDGTAIPYSSFTWTKTDGTTSTGEYLIVNTPGIYKVKVTPNGSTTGCTTISYIIKENFHIEQWEKAQNLNFKDGTAVTVIPILHKSIEKAAILYDLGIKNDPVSKNAVVSKLLRYTLPNGAKQSEVLYIIPTPYYLAHNNNLINGNNLDGFVLTFTETERKFLGGWYYHNGSPIFRVKMDFNLFAEGRNCKGKVCWTQIARTQEGDYTSEDFAYYPYGCSDPTRVEDFVEPGSKLVLAIPTSCVDNPTRHLNNDSNTNTNPNPPESPWNNTPTGAGDPLWEWNKPRGGGGSFSNYSPYTPTILKDDYDFNNTALNQYVNGITKILSEVGNRYPNLNEFSDSEFSLLLNLIQTALRKSLPNDASSINFNNITPLVVNAFRNSDYQSVAYSLINSFGPLQTGNPNVIRNAILNNVDNIVNSFYALSTISKTLASTSGQNLANNIVNILQTQGKDVSKTLLLYENNIYMSEVDLQNLWTGLGGNINNPQTIINSDGVEIIFKPETENNEAKLTFNRNGFTISIEKDFGLKEIYSTLAATPRVTLFEEFKKNTVAMKAFANILKTQEGANFINQFKPTGIHKNVYLILGSPKLGGVRLGATYMLEYPPGVQRFQIGSNLGYDVKTAVLAEVNLRPMDETLDANPKYKTLEYVTATMAHEFFAHVQEDLDRLARAYPLAVNSTNYTALLNCIKDSADPDHRKLARGEITKLNNIISQLDVLTNSKKHAQAYTDDKNTHSKDKDNPTSPCN
ncbi:hypothetical protein [Emticicia soli]|uniref:PKD domain-containing protein n=1 Tax=Emticicia soli TaxID=2027878 RepID=A0ABW5J9U4_9BACT